MTKIRALFASRRFYAAVLGCVAVVLQEALGMEQQTATTLATLIAAWILGDSLKETKLGV